MSSNNSIKFSQIALASFAFFSLMLISGTTISTLNPIVEQSNSNVTAGTVKGLTTTEVFLPLELSLNKVENSQFEIDILTTHIESYNSLGTVVVSSKNLGKGEYSESLLTLYNPNNESAKTKVSFFLRDELKGALKVYLEDEKDSLIMYTIEESYGVKTITLPELSERNFSIRVEALEDVNSNIELVFAFTVGP